MASLSLSISSLAAIKKPLREEFPDVRSSHLSEALAAALRRRTHAALLADVRRNADDPPIELLDTELFCGRLHELGYARDEEFSFDFINIPEVINTLPSSAFDIEYKSARQKAWRNLLVSTVNEAIRRKMISLRPSDNRWPGADPTNMRRTTEDSVMFDFPLPQNGLPARAYIFDIGHDELSIHIAVNPKGDWVKVWNAGFDAGEAFATGWLERQKGAWLQSAHEMFNCRKVLLPAIAGMEVQPLGYGDRGRVM